MYCIPYLNYISVMIVYINQSPLQYHKSYVLWISSYSSTLFITKREVQHYVIRMNRVGLAWMRRWYPT
jgi:hypothetical protein